jgi:acetate kinase
MSPIVLVLNVGSSSIKFSLFQDEQELPLILKGKIVNLQGNASFYAADKRVRVYEHGVTHEQALVDLLKWVELSSYGGAIKVVGHRIVHGGAHFHSPVILNISVLSDLEAFTPLAPLHQPFNLMAVPLIQRIDPTIQQVGCFDTAFHVHQPALFQTYALSAHLRGLGIRKYGFHGLSYEWITTVLRTDYPEMFHKKIIAAHLGNGASLCALYKGKSIETTMGMSILEGMPMGTRCGSLDPGVVLYLQRHLGMGLEEIEHELFYQSGLKGLSELTNDMAVLLSHRSDSAKFAVEYYVTCVAQFVAKLAVSLGGIDGLVFTGGIGENSSEIRQRVMEKIAFLGLVKSIVIEANEERMMAIHCQQLIHGEG